MITTTASYTYLFTREHEGGGRFVSRALEVPHFHLSTQVPSQHFIVFQEAHTAQRATVSTLCRQNYITCQYKTIRRTNKQPMTASSPILRTGFFCLAVSSNRRPSSPTDTMSSSKHASPVQGLEPPKL
ncbi:hypothetical protein L798_14317 [Zootermopsis nevadensis]|uniref:Uncharacterized protein n=1 Tax=Zootermopsis nevadensis TaxID=136037 RepID=A0A067QZS0_ZOONE|nr:hypothetical protein L798_14317 [Zootermopsis nevadensis]